ncbi:MAG TPA: hypothetical protein VJR89_15195 [Polyangiales bacterium]|nr:hypothetical protein [Polyangiales bacterium]
MSVRDFLFGLCLALAAAGCDDLSEFKTSKSTVFRGEVVGSDSDPQSTSSFIRQGFASHTRMDLDFDPYATSLPVDGDRTPSPPGRVHTYVCPADDRECSPSQGTAGPFDRARLEPFENLAHDSLSEYTFPGGGRLRNYIFNVRFATELEGETPLARNAMLFISLMDSGRVEVRAMAPSALAPDGKSEQAPALFGVFVLDSQSR